MRDGVMEFTLPPMHRQVWLRQWNTHSNVLMEEYDVPKPSPCSEFGRGVAS